MEIYYAGFASFVFVFLKAFQQRNVAFNHYLPVVPISLAMAATEIYVVSAVVVLGYSLALVASVGLGGGIGACIAMYLHNVIYKRGA